MIYHKPEEMSFLTKEYGVEFGLVYRHGNGKNGDEVNIGYTQA
jgi:hypothetical protein